MPTPDLAARFRAARTDPALAVLEGFHAIKHAIRFGASFEVVVAKEMAGVGQLVAQLAPDLGEAFEQLTRVIPAPIFDQLSPTPPETGIIAIAKRSPASLATVLALPAVAPIVLLESPSHSGNIGAAVRVAAGAGAAAVVTTGSNDPWNPGALRGSAGLHYALPVVRADTMDFGARELIAIDPEGEDPGGAAIGAGAVLAFGSERTGLSPSLLARANRRVRIPMEPGVSSLNLATAVAVMLYTWRLRR